MNLGIFQKVLVIGLAVGSAIPWEMRAAWGEEEVRFNDWQDQGCWMAPGGMGAPASGATGAGGNQAHCTPCGISAGMATWWVNEPYLSLWVADEPLSYRTSGGQPIAFRWTYRPREGFANGDLRFRQWRGVEKVPIRVREVKEYATTDSAAWCHNWWSEIVCWDTNFESHVSGFPTLDPAPPSTPTRAYWSFHASYEALAFLGDGSTLYFNGATAATPNGASKVRLEIVGQVSTNGGPKIPAWHSEVPWPYEPDASGVVWVDDPQYGLRVVYPNGSQDVYGFVLEVGWHTCPYGAGDPRCQVQIPPKDYTARAYLTQRIDPQGRVTRIGYQKTQNPVAGQPAYRVGYVVDADGRTNTYHYNPENLYQLQRIVDAWGRTNSVAYSGGNEKLLASITDAAGLTTSFSYQPPVTAVNCYYGYANLVYCSSITHHSGWLTSLTTPYGTTAFSWFEDVGTNGFDAVRQRALLASEPEGAHQLFYYRQNGQGLLPAQAAEVPTVPGYGFDPGTNGAAGGQLYYRNSFHWDRGQFAALSAAARSYLAPAVAPPPGQVNLPAGLTNLTANDFRKAALQHWLSGSDGYSISATVSSQRDPSPDGEGRVEGARRWYDYADKDPNNPHTESSQPLPGCIALVLADGSSQYALWDYTGGGFPWRHCSTITLANGSAGVRTNWYQYATNGVDLLSVSNSTGQYVNLGYNTNHQVLFVTNALGQVSQAAYDPDTRNLTSLTLPSGQNVTLSYYASNALSPNGRMQSNINWSATGRVRTFTWSNGLPLVVQSGGTGLPSLTVTNFWDGLNRLTGVSFPDGTTVSNVYDRLDVGARKDRLNHWTGYGYDGLQNLTSVTDARSNVTTLGWCDCGALDSITDALTNTTSVFYNNQGLWTNLVFADHSSLSCTRDALGRPTRLADGQNRWLSAGYNNQGLLTGVSNAYGRVWSAVYDALDRPIRVTDANGITVTNQFDLLNRLTNRFWLDGVGEEFGWSAKGLVAYTNRNGKVTRFDRDAAGRLTAVTNASLEVTSVAYNALNQVTDLWDGRTNHTVWHYNEYGWLTSKVDALSREVLRLTRDANGQVTNRWTPEFGETGYVYDEVGNLRAINCPQSTINYTFDALNRLQAMVDAVGTNTFGYTPAGQLQSEDGPWAYDTLTYSYTQGQRTTVSINSSPPSTINYSWDAAWRLYTLTSPAGSFGYEYSQAPFTFHVSRITLPNSAWITNHFDSLSRLDYTALVNRWGHVLDGYGYGHDLLGLRTNITRDLGLTNSSVSVGYDSIGQLTSWRAREGLSGPLRLNEQLAFVYDQAGDLRYRTNGGLVQTFNCDAVNQLTNVTRNNTMTVSGNTPAPASSVTVNGQAAQTYGDFTFARTNVTLSEGNNTFAIIAENPHGLRVTNTLNSSLPSTINLQWDSNGNLTNDGSRSFAYDAENQLTNISAAGSWRSEFVYDGLGRRRLQRDYGWQGGQWVKTNEARYVYDGWLPVQERDSNNVPVVSYTRGVDLSGSLHEAGGIGGLLARTDTNGSAFYHADGAGNVTGLMDGSQTMAARYLYTAFGGLVGKWGPLADVDQTMFSSRMHLPHAEDVYDFGGRQYTTIPQRWLQRDPLGTWPDTNPYRFNYNNPLSYVDPDGLAPQLVTVTSDLSGRQTAAGYASYYFGQDYGIGLHGPLGPGGEITLMTGATMVPGVGEMMDLSVLRDPGSKWWERGLAGGSLLLNVMTDGFAPNAGGLLSTGRKVCRTWPKHHPWPEYLGGLRHQTLKKMPRKLHEKFHADLDAWQGGKYARTHGAEHFEGIDAAEIISDLRQFYGKNYPTYLNDFERAVQETSDAATKLK